MWEKRGGGGGAKTQRVEADGVAGLLLLDPVTTSSARPLSQRFSFMFNCEHYTSAPRNAYYMCKMNCCVWYATLLSSWQAQGG